MNFKVVVLIKDQIGNIQKFLDIFREDDIVFVLDRPSVDELKVKSPKRHIINTYGSGFMAGHCRNLGEQYWQVNAPSADICFFDGDRYPPNAYIFQAIGNFIKHYDIILWGVKNDSRLKAMAKSFFYENNRSFLEHPKNISNIFYSCGFYIKRTAIDDIKKISEGHLFHPAFNGHWGNEDRFMGNCALKLGLKYIFDFDTVLNGTMEYTDDKRKEYDGYSLKTQIELINKLI